MSKPAGRKKTGVRSRTKPSRKGSVMPVMEQSGLPRRSVLKGGAGVALSGVTVMSVAGPAQAFPGHAEVGVVVPWLDQPTPVPPANAEILAHPLQWERIQYLTPNDE